MMNSSSSSPAPRPKGSGASSGLSFSRASKRDCAAWQQHAAYNTTGVNKHYFSLKQRLWYVFNCLQAHVGLVTLHYSAVEMRSH
jgi:hypothetical protein